MCVGRSFLHLLVGCFLCRCRRAALGFVLHGSRALSLALLLLRPRPLLLPLLPSYSCVAFFLTFAEFIDIFSICFCALLSLSERALSLFLPLFLSLSRFFFLFRSLSHYVSHTHTHKHLFFLFFIENNLQFYLIALLSSLLHTRTHTHTRLHIHCWHSCCFL